MFISKDITRYVSILTIFATLMFGNTGCTFLTKPPEFPTHDIEYNITDQDVVLFTNNLRHMLRTKMHFTTIGAYVASFTAVAVGSAAAIYAATGGSRAAVAALAASGVFAADTLGIFKPKEHATAYQGGLALIEDAEARYFKKIATRYKGKVSNTELTRAGADLYIEVVNSLRLVEKAIVAQIPTEEEVRAATGTSLDKKTELQLSQYEINLPLPPSNGNATVTAEVIAIKNGPIKIVASPNKDIATADLSNEGIKVTITAKSRGDTVITVLSKEGSVQNIQVTVGE